jgi:hypothetical protein
MGLPEIRGKRILYGVLNWGLGHASRSSVVIEHLLSGNNQVDIASSGAAFTYLKNRFPGLGNNQVDIASSGAAFTYLKNRFPGLAVHAMQSREITYPSHGQLWFGLMLQYPKFLGMMKHETAWVKKQVEAEKDYDMVISDNAYGFFHPGMKNVFMTHQVNLKTPFFEKKINRKIHSFLNPFDELWIPDMPGELNLAGELAHPPLTGKKCTYIHPLSLPAKPSVQPKKYTWCAVISGPEKQRTVFENTVLDFLTGQPGPSIIVRGTRSKRLEREVHDKITVHDFLTGNEMQDILAASETLIARCGYSTIMDMYAWQMPCILVPTPGQTEQEYLFSKHFGHKFNARNWPQKKLISLCSG